MSNPTPCIILLLCFFFYLATIQVTYSNNETDFQALVAFKNAIDSDPQGVLLSWNETVPFCSWQGIFCSNKHRNRVVAIDLFSQGLTGPVSPHLGNLSFLKSIRLRNNTFYGQIPNEIGRLRRLEYVELSNNSFSGEIPKNISQCTNIYYLNLIDNELNGVIPLELSSLMKLEKLGLGVNYLSGTIPPFLGNLSNLIQLSITKCGMQGEIPESLVQLKSLKNLFLSVNNLTGTIPPGMFNISTMSAFELYSNRLVGTIPSDIGSAFPNLIYLNLWGNLFTGEIPASLSNLSLLEDLRLQYNNFTGKVNIDFSRLSELKIVGLGDNDLEGDLSFISSMINCTQLLYFGISSNQLSGLLPHSIANLSRNLEVFATSDNQLHGRIPPGIGDLIGLMNMDLEKNDLDGPIPSEISKFNNLQSLYLDENMFTSEIPSSFGNLTSLLSLHLEHNNLSGNIPQSLGNCSSLLEFNVSYNNLNGPIPYQIMSQLLSSTYLDMSNNALTSSIPVEVGSLINLGLLDLSYNRLSGHVPNSLSGCVRLEEIYFRRNSFDGEIPDGLRSMRGLQRVDISQNNLLGTIPAFLGELNLLYLNLSFNRLEGRVPSQGVFMNESAVSLDGNKDLCGGIPSLKFAPCSLENSKKHKQFPLVFKILIPVISVAAIALAFYCITIRVQRKSKHAQTSDVVLLEGYLRLSYADLQKSTGGFLVSNLLGTGKFGSVYKGILHDTQIPVAVKVLHLNVKGASRSFMSECNVLKGIRHRNLLKILSVCSSTDFQENDFKALVYEFMANGNLETWLHRPEDGTERQTLSLRQRLDIVIDIAYALEYLHVGTDLTVVHGDLKPSNILLDEDMTAHVGDFGLAKIISDIFSTNDSTTSVGIKGTIGYIPPEYGVNGVVSTQGDVYSYGILMLEMFTGRRPTHEDLENTLTLHDFVRNAVPSQVMEVLDPVIIQEYNHRMDVNLLNCVVSILEIGLTCSAKLPRDRMEMSDVVNVLQKASQILSQS